MLEYPCWLYLFVIAMFVFGVVITVYFFRYIRREDPDDSRDEVMRQAARLRERAQELNIGSSEIEARAKRLEQLVRVQKRGQS